MTRRRAAAYGLLLLCSGIAVVIGFWMNHANQEGMLDFKAVYYAAKCLAHHKDPYKPADFLSVYRADNGSFPSNPKLLNAFLKAVPTCINLPTSFVLTIPLAFLPWSVVTVLWLALVTVLLTTAAFLTWDLSRNYAPGTSLFLICLLLLNSEVIFASGNLAGVVVSLSVIAVWCFVKQRHLFAGVVAMGTSLVLKPHDAAFLWLFFFVADVAYRRRALQSLLVVLIISLPAVLLVSHIAPHWVQEMRLNIVSTSAAGGMNDPGPTGLSSGNIGAIIGLQSDVSILRDDPHFYNPVCYAVCGIIFLVWAIKAVRSQFSMERIWLSVAALIPLTLLVTYHRPYDARLLLLTIPACALLWASGGVAAAVALVLTTAGIAFTGDITSSLWFLATRQYRVPTTLWTGKLLTVVLLQPAPLILLGMSIFYLRAYLNVRRDLRPFPTSSQR
jgi:hypothetical protein